MRVAVRSQNQVKVHISSKDVLTIAGLRQLLKPCPFIRITATSADEHATMSALRSEIPDVLVLNAGDEQEMYGSVRAARGISESLKVVVLVEEALAVQLMGTSRIRLEGILVRGGESLQDIGAVLRVVHHGGKVTSTYYEPGHVVPEHEVDPEVTARLQSLSVREATILRELAKGCTNAEIARPLHVSVATIKADLARITNTMKASSRVDLAVLAVRSGFIDQPAPARKGSPPAGDGGRAVTGKTGIRGSAR